MAVVGRGVRHETDVLVRQLDGHLATLRATHPVVDVDLAERIAATLRRLVTETASASAADRARVRAAVHFFVMRWDSRHERRPSRPLAVDLRVVNEIVCDLGRRDLLVSVDLRGADRPGADLAAGSGPAADVGTEARPERVPARGRDGGAGREVDLGTEPRPYRTPAVVPRLAPEAA